MEELDDLTLARARRGDRGAQGALIVCYGDRVHRLLARLMVAHPSGVEDALQDSLLKVLRGLPSFDPAGPAKLSSWVLTVATRSGIDALRKCARLPPPPPPEEAEQQGSGPEEILRARDLERRVKRAMAALPDDQRAVLILRAYHDLDYPEIAAALEIEVGTVKSRLSRARAALKAALGEETQHG